jgi:hypothetical protein
MLTAAGIGLTILLTASAAHSGWQRRRLLAAFRANWGQPVLRARDPTAISGYFRSRAHAADPHEYIDDRTWADLNLDAVFERTDRTASTLGQQVLYNRLRTATGVTDLLAFERLVSRMTDEPHARERAHVALGALQDPSGYDLWWLAQPGAVDRHPRQIVYLFLAGTMVGALVLSLKWPAMLLVVIFGAVLNLIVRALTAGRVTQIAGPFRQISALIGVAESLLFLADDDQTPIVGALRRDLASLQRLKRIVRSVGLDPLGSGELPFALFEYLNLLFLLDVNAVYLGAGELRKTGPTLLRVIAAVGDVDAAISVASVRAGNERWTRPSFLPAGSRASFLELRHPLLEECVPNSLELDLPGGALITGSNMSGKTTFIRTVGVNVVLGQAINTCFADRYEAPVFRVRSCIGTSDDLLAGESYYGAEVDAVLAVVAASRSPVGTLFLFDELFRGTNALERIAAAEAVLHELIDDRITPKPHVVLAASHDIELVGYLTGVYAAFHFADGVGPDGLTFDYRIRPGISLTRNALALLERRGAPTSVVTRARERAARLDALRSEAEDIGST